MDFNRLSKNYQDIGTHVANFNTPSIGISCNGNFENKQPTPEQLASVRYLLQKIQSDLGPKTIIGHKEAPGASTLCPGKYFPLSELKNVGIAGLERNAYLYNKNRSMKNPKTIDERTHIGNGQYIGMANNVPEHQDVQGIIYQSLYKPAKQIGLKASTETPIKAIKGIIGKIIPDVLVRDAYDNPIIIVEVCYAKDVHTNEKDGITKVRKVAQAHETVMEAFVCDFENLVLYRLSRSDNFKTVTQTDYSAHLQTTVICDENKIE